MRAAALVALLLSAAGCSLLLNTAEPTQCSSQRDCDANPSLRNRVCEEGFCVIPRAKDDPVGADGGAACVSNDLCTQANSGKASVCKQPGSPCTPWVTERCPAIEGDWDTPDPIVVGAILPFKVKQSSGTPVVVNYTDRLRRAMDLGLDEVKIALPDGIAIPGGARRKLAILYCDSQYDAALAQEAMTHLTDVVGAPVVIAGSDVDLAAIRAQALEKKTAVVCSDCVAPFPAEPLAFRVVPPLVQEAGMAAWRVGQLETEIKAGPTPPATLRVAVFKSGDAAPVAFATALTEQLVFNGTSATGNAGAYTVITSGNPQEGSVDFVAKADEVAAFEPDVVVVAMGAEFAVNYLQLLEAKWTSAKPKPHYVLTALEYEVAPFGPAIGASNEDLRKRLSGTKPAFDAALQANIDAYSTRYRIANNFKAPDGNFSGYDAFFTTAYGIVAASIQQVIDGPHIVSGIERLRGGATVIDVGPNQLGLGIALLGTQTTTIDLRGLISNLDWDPLTRDLVVPESGLWCIERFPDGSIDIKADAGPRRNNGTGVVTGVYACD